MFEAYSDEELKKAYEKAKSCYVGFDFSELNIIFEVALTHKALFPDIAHDTDDVEEYFNKWVSRYCKAMRCLPSQRMADPKKSCSDLAVRTIVATAKKISNEEAEELEKNHNLFMSAENIQGSLLEEYIARNVRKFGFYWAAGTVLRSVDFCNDNGTCLLQVKNKFNTENSSSNQIRKGTDIKKWFRLGQKVCKGIPYAEHKWDDLNSIINEFKANGAAPCDMSEEGYSEFISGVVTRNPSIITDE